MEPRDCDKIRALFSERLDGLLSPADCARMDSHLSACESCRKEWVKLKAAKDLLQASPALQPPESFYAKVLEQTTRKEMSREPSLPYFKVLAFASIFGITVFSVFKTWKDSRSLKMQESIAPASPPAEYQEMQRSGDIARIAPQRKSAEINSLPRMKSEVNQSQDLPMGSASGSPELQVQSDFSRSAKPASSPAPMGYLAETEAMKEKSAISLKAKAELKSDDSAGSSRMLQGRSAGISALSKKRADAGFKTSVIRESETWKALWESAKVAPPPVDFTRSMVLVVHSAPSNQAAQIADIQVHPHQIEVTYRTAAKENPLADKAGPAPEFDYRIVPKNPSPVTFHPIP